MFLWNPKSSEIGLNQSSKDETFREIKTVYVPYEAGIDFHQPPKNGSLHVDYVVFFTDSAVSYPLHATKLNGVFSSLALFLFCWIHLPVLTWGPMGPFYRPWRRTCFLMTCVLWTGCRLPPPSRHYRENNNELFFRLNSAACVESSFRKKLWRHFRSDHRRRFAFFHLPSPRCHKVSVSCSERLTRGLSGPWCFSAGLVYFSAIWKSKLDSEIRPSSFVPGGRPGGGGFHPHSASRRTSIRFGLQAPPRRRHSEAPKSPRASRRPSTPKDLVAAGQGTGMEATLVGCLEFRGATSPTQIGTPMTPSPLSRSIPRFTDDGDYRESKRANRDRDSPEPLTERVTINISG